MASIGQRLLNLYSKLSVIPGGQFIFKRFIAFHIPYTGSIGAQVLELRPGYAKLCLNDKRAIRNHLNSIHAVALTNFGEFTSGLALLAGLPDNVRGIVIQICTDYFKKARGRLIAECHCTIPPVSSDIDFFVEATITDHAQEVVARVKVLWRLGLKPN